MLTPREDVKKIIRHLGASSQSCRVCLNNQYMKRNYSVLVGVSHSVCVCLCVCVCVCVCVTQTVIDPVLCPSDSTKCRKRARARAKEQELFISASLYANPANFNQ